MSGVAGEVRPAAVAGLFYPSDPGELRDTVAHCLSVSSPDDANIEAPPGARTDGSKAVIAPHAGYRYSGPTAGHAYRALAPTKQVERVVIIGPAHRVRLDGIGLTTAQRWAMPFGDIEVDQEACRQLADVPGVVEADEAHRPEHSIEVHLPFIHELFGPVPVVPLVVGRASIRSVARVLEQAWGGEETVIVASSDLSHYLDNDTARARDRKTALAILEGRAGDIGPQDACGCLPISGLLTAGLQRGLSPQLLDLSTSADTAGEPSRVVGYGSFALTPSRLELRDEDKAWLLGLAGRTIGHEVTKGEPYPLTDDDVPPMLRTPGASFVTLQRDDKLLGCIGSLEVRRALWRDVARNARGAAFDDPRFPPLTVADLPRLAIEVSVLSPLEEHPAPSLEELAQSLRPGIDGLLLAADERRATFLPDVWEKIPDPGDFVRELTRKARWSEAWVEGAQAWRYTTVVTSGELGAGPDIIGLA